MLLLFYGIVRDGYHEPASLVGYLRSIDDSVFLNHFRELLQIDQATDGWINVDIIENALEIDRASERMPFREEATRLVALLQAPTQFRTKMADVLEWFHRRYLSPNARRVREEVEGRIERLRQRIESDPVRTLDALSGGNYETLLSVRDTIEIFPVHLAGAEHSMMLQETAYAVMGTAFLDHILDVELAPGRLAERTDELVKALSDPKRLAILRLLRHRPSYGKEIADELGISAATISYHLDKLLGAHLVRLDLAEGRRFYYALNPDGVRTLIDCLDREFLREEADG